MLSITELADATLRAKATMDRSCSMPAAARKALQGKGIFNENNIRKRIPEIMAELAARKGRPKPKQEV